MTDWLTPSQQRAWRALLDLNTHLHAALARSLQGSSDLSYADFAVLVQLTEAPQGRTRISELADLLQWERSRLSHHLKRMESRGHIERSNCPEDRRGQYVAVTPIGRAAIEQAAPSHVELVRELVFADMSDAEVALLTSLSDRVIARLDQVPQKVT